mmetsp:Transcript_6610/g.15903  ORF Transcript_6610/g.15903 Transcript_6610/m.15903 type:complete len:133 (+) Transcript_6610:165-563(+)
MSLDSAVGQVVFPGDPVVQIPLNEQLRVGTGLQQRGEEIISNKAGLVCRTSTGKFWLQVVQKRYVPAVDDLVIGIITERHGEASTFTVFLNLFALYLGGAQRLRALSASSCTSSSPPPLPNARTNSVVQIRW